MTAPEYTTLVSVVRAALGEKPPEPADAAVAALALTYAQAIDDQSADLAKVGPALLASLEALQMSPRARALAARGLKTDGPARSAKLDELRKRRERKHATAPGDATTA